MRAVTCVICEKIFETEHSRKITCSTDCQAEYKKKINNVSRKRMVRTKSGNCAVCGVLFEFRRYSKNCSKECRSVYLRRQYEKMNEERRGNYEWMSSKRNREIHLRISRPDVTVNRDFKRRKGFTPDKELQDLLVARLLLRRAIKKAWE